MFVILCSKSIKKEKCKDKKDVHSPQTQHTPITIDEDDVLVGPWLSAGGNKKDAKVNSRPQSDDDHAATLIVCPLSVLSNWTVSMNLAAWLLISTPQITRITAQKELINGWQETTYKNNQNYSTTLNPKTTQNTHEGWVGGAD